MLKRFTKSGKKQSKSGVILITILFILAVAFILIGSALMMTANTRKRLYSFAESSQARLTVTSAAQVLENAIQSQQLPDCKLKDLCDAGTTVWFTDPSIPGMAGTASDYPDNCTCATFGWVESTKPTITVTTRIDDEVENVLLTYEGTPTASNTSPFDFQVELGEGGRLDKVAVGNIYNTQTRYDAEDNVVVSRGDGSAPFDECRFFSTFVTTKPMKSASNSNYYGDLVFAGPTSGVTMAGGATGSGAMIWGGNVYFINSSQIVYDVGNADDCHEMFTDKSGGTSQIIFCGVGSAYGTGAGCDRPFCSFAAGSVYDVNYATGTGITYGGHYGYGITNDQGAFNAGTTGIHNSNKTGKDLAYYIGNLDRYMNTEYIAPGQTYARPSCYKDFVEDAARQDPPVSLSMSGSAPAGASPLDASGVNTAGVYKCSSVGSTMYEISVSSGNVIVYLDGLITIGEGGGFTVSGGNGSSSSYRCYFIISRGGGISFQGNNQPSGFFSMNCHAVAKTDPIIQTQAPIIYIIGSGTNHNANLTLTGSNKGQVSCQVNQNNYCEAMVALYAYDDTVANPDPGDFCTNIGGAMHFYGRIIAHTIQNTNGEPLYIPYCPQFSTGDDPNQLYEVRSAYTLVSFDYFYDDPNRGTGNALHT